MGFFLIFKFYLILLKLRMSLGNENGLNSVFDIITFYLHENPIIFVFHIHWVGVSVIWNELSPHDHTLINLLVI